MDGDHQPVASALRPDVPAELLARVRAAAPQVGVNASAWPALSLLRADHPAANLPSVYEPSLCVVVQGSKRAVLGPDSFQYDAGHFLVVSLTLPVMAHILEASVERPYLCIRLGLDPVAISDLLLHRPSPRAPASAPNGRGLYMAPMSTELADALLRLMRALDTPDDLPILAPMQVREVCYRVLTGPLGSRLQDLVDSGGQARRIARAIELIRHQVDQPLRVAQLAEALHMSESSLHHRFKQLTTLTPVQYQKRLRLHEARRLMQSEGLPAASAGSRVGYQSPSQFSRDYRRLFGAPPRRSLAAG